MADLVLLEPGTSVFSGGEVRVAILPVGDVPRHAMDAYMGCINQYRHIPLSSMRAHYRESAPKTPFGNLDWEKGFMHFRFLHLDEARKKSRTCDLHRQRQVVAVLGVVHCPWTPSLHGAHAEFSKMCSLLFPEAPIQRCLLANPTTDHVHQSRESNYESMIVFQPGGGIRHLEHEFSFWLHDLAAQILAELEHCVLSASPLGMPMGPACYADSPEFTCSSPAMEDVARRFTLDEDEAHEKKRWGRLMKTKGDLCLMAGSCQDAFDHYRTCSDLARISTHTINL
ncbi:TRAPP II complex [Dunaliella salina]|uniref:TRAPP II complex n=1 Tax=Dunaliella salina TaxID=3046 RepID=A0ABQ7G3E5_DUNSA|nr:TRAPP II complex [Dunaliella salina]|eukprot:KAF5829122.1 TRAPP II complex [Dunaliella salina]